MNAALTDLLRNHAQGLMATARLLVDAANEIESLRLSIAVAQFGQAGGGGTSGTPAQLDDRLGSMGGSSDNSPFK